MFNNESLEAESNGPGNLKVTAGPWRQDTSSLRHITIPRGSERITKHRSMSKGTPSVKALNSAFVFDISVTKISTVPWSLRTAFQDDPFYTRDSNILVYAVGSWFLTRLPHHPSRIRPQWFRHNGFTHIPTLIWLASAFSSAFFKNSQI